MQSDETPSPRYSGGIITPAEGLARGRDAFTALRIAAAVGVLISHAWPLALGREAVAPLERLTGQSLGHVCVVIFISISGFFVTRSFDQGRSWQRFVEGRALRLFPGLAVMLLATLLVGLAITPEPARLLADAPGYFLRNITLAEVDYTLPGLFEATPYGPVVNGSLWSLFFEAVLYLVVLLAGLGGLFARPRGRDTAVVLFALACLVGPFAVEQLRVVRLCELGLPFSIGAALYLWRDRVPLSWTLAAGLMLLAPLGGPVLSLALAYGAILVGFRGPKLRLPDYSYGIYIYAFPLQQTAAAVGVETPLGNIAASFLPTLLCAALSWHLVERPALRLKGRRRRAAVRQA
ncbi:acyltransferase family protein [Palleronia sp.]|uniref:acyltransferase family protein n=1 Tax=Palleronia sp. TaxID=1940284 RepID=UPI0035C80AC0